MHTKHYLQKLAKDTNKSLQDAKQQKEELKKITLSNKVQCIVKQCYAEMETAALQGRFYTEVNVPADLEVNELVMDLLEEFNPHLVSDGYTRQYISLNWGK